MIGLAGVFGWIALNITGGLLARRFYFAERYNLNRPKGDPNA